MKKLVFVLLCFSFRYVQGQEPFPSFIISLDKFPLKGKALLKRYRFSTTTFYKDSVFIDTRDDSDQLTFDNYATKTTVSVIIHPFPVSTNRIVRIGKGTIYSLRITNFIAHKVMRIYFRSCVTLGYGQRVLLNGLQFIPGVFFFDMLSSQKIYETPCDDYTITLKDIPAHQITLDSLKILAKETTQ